MVWPRRLALSAAALTGGSLVAACILAAYAPTRTSATNLVFGLVVASLAAGLGVVIAQRTSGNPVGPLLAFLGLTVALTVTREIAWQVLSEDLDRADRFSWLVAALEQGAFWVLTAVALLLLHFPDGRVPSRRWRWVPLALVAATAVTQVHGVFDQTPFRPPLEEVPRPLGPAPVWFEALGFVAFLATLSLALASTGSLVARYRHSDQLRRKQIKWLAVGGVSVAAYPMLCLIEIVLWGEPSGVSDAVGLAGLAAIPITTAIAMLRHDLYDVDRALAGAVTWGLATAALVVMYVVALAGAGLVLGHDSAVAAAGVTAVAAVALSPLRQRLHVVVDRRLYPLRRAAFEAIDALHAEVSAGEAVPEELEARLRVALRDDGLGLQHGVLTSESPDLSAELLRQIEHRAGGLIEMVRLRSELARALHDVESSRARLVQAGYEERRRLEKDLHDGAQQRLVSLGMSMRLAQRHLNDGTVDMDALIDECVAELGTAVAELRQLAHGIRPSSLDDGLPAAVARLVRGVPLAVELKVDDSALPDDVATTAYFVISESLANAVKHAEASRIGLEVSRVNGQVLVRVSDDGRGGATLSPASSIADRVAALGGSLRVASPAGRGTVVEAELPCVS